MYGYLLDYPDQDTVQPQHFDRADTERPDSLFATRYQNERQRVYDRAAYMTDSGAYTPADVEDAKSEAALVRSEVQVSRARGDQLGWVRHMLRRGAVARFGYRNPPEMVASRLDTRRSTARELVYLAERLADHQIESIRSGAVSYERVLAETRLAEAGASAEAIERSRDLDLESVKRLLQQHRKMSRQDERAIFEGQYISMQPSLDGRHVQVNGRLGALEADICRQGLDRRGERLLPAGETRPGVGQRRALALTTLCQDELDRGPQRANTTAERIRQARRRREPALMVLANQPLADTSANEQGVAVLAGARVGPDTVDLVQCVGTTEVITVSGQNILHHGTTTSMRPSLRRAVLAATTAAPSTDAPPPTASKPTTSPPDPKAGPTQQRTWQRCAGTTTTSPYTAEACASTPNHHPDAGGYCHQGQEPAATGHPNPTPTPSPSSEHYIPPLTAPRPDQAATPATTHAPQHPGRRCYPPF